MVSNRRVCLTWERRVVNAMNLHPLLLTSLLRGNLSSYIIITPSLPLPSQLEALCLLLQLYFGTRVISFAVLFCALFSLMFCSMLFCVICANAARFSITLSCECAYVIRSPPTQKSVPLSQRAGMRTWSWCLALPLFAFRAALLSCRSPSPSFSLPRSLRLPRSSARWLFSDFQRLPVCKSAASQWQLSTAAVSKRSKSPT